MKYKKIIAPLIITLLLILYFCWQLYTCFIKTDFSPFWGILGAMVVLALIGVSVFVLVERINEIRKGEEDDLSKY